MQTTKPTLGEILHRAARGQYPHSYRFRQALDSEKAVLAEAKAHADSLVGKKVYWSHQLYKVTRSNGCSVMLETVRRDGRIGGSKQKGIWVSASVVQVIS